MFGGIQTRIAKATKEGRWRRVKALQRMLTCSFCAKALAVKRITENQGKRTSGVNRELWNTPEGKFGAISNLNNRGYKISPLRRIVIPRSRGKERPLGILTMRDRAHAGSVSRGIGTRMGKNERHEFLWIPHHAVKLWVDALLAERGLGLSSEKTRFTHSDDGFDFLGWNFRIYFGKFLIEPSKKTQLRFDRNIRDAVSTSKAVKQFDLIRLLNLKLRGWTLHYRHVVAKETFNKMGYLGFGLVWRWALRRHPIKSKKWAKRLYFQTIEGRQWLTELFGVVRPKRLKGSVVRHADDFVATGVTSERLQDTIRPWVEAFLSKRGLTRSKDKTRITHIDDGSNFLGWNFRKYSGTFLSKLSKRNVLSFNRTVRETVTTKLGAKQEVLIRLQNPRIYGWHLYHREDAARETFARMHSLIFQLL